MTSREEFEKWISTTKFIGFGLGKDMKGIYLDDDVEDAWIIWQAATAAAKAKAIEVVATQLKKAEQQRHNGDSNFLDGLIAGISEIRNRIEKEL